MQLLFDGATAVVGILLRTPVKQSMDSEGEQLLYHGIALFSGMMALLVLEDVRHIVAIIHNSHLANSQPPRQAKARTEIMPAGQPSQRMPSCSNANATTADNACCSSRRTNMWSRTKAAQHLVCSLCAIAGATLIGEAVLASRRCEHVWEEQLGDAAKCTYPRYMYGADTTCGLVHVTSIKCSSTDLANLPERSYADLVNLKCIDVSQNSQLNRIPEQWWHELTSLEQLNVSFTNLPTLPRALCNSKSTRANPNLTITVKGSPAAKFANWSSMGKFPVEALLEQHGGTGGALVFKACIEAVKYTLERLDVSNNALRKIKFENKGTISGLPAVEWLDVQNNELELVNL